MSGQLHLMPDEGIDRALPIGPQVYDLLRQCIVDNRLSPGARISEGALAAGLDISRTPLRAALQQLASEGMVETRPQVGSVVAAEDPGRLEEAVFLRAALEVAVVRRLAERDDFDPGQLDEVFSQQERAARADDYAAFFRLDEAFHARLCTMAGLPTTWRLIQSVKGHVDRQRYRMMAGIPMRSLRAYEEHLAIVERISAGDARGAVMRMQAHVNSVLDLDAPQCVETDRRAPQAAQHTHEYQQSPTGG